MSDGAVCFLVGMIRSACRRGILGRCVIDRLLHALRGGDGITDNSVRAVAVRGQHDDAANDTQRNQGRDNSDEHNLTARRHSSFSTLLPHVGATQHAVRGILGANASRMSRRSGPGRNPGAGDTTSTALTVALAVQSTQGCNCVAKVIRCRMGCTRRLYAATSSRRTGRRTTNAPVHSGSPHRAVLTEQSGIGVMLVIAGFGSIRIVIAEFIFHAFR